jgi:hypothetical protein
MNYILVKFSDGTVGYQEIDPYGNVTQYTDETGNVLFSHAPTGLGSSVMDANPPRLGWMI